MRDRGSRSLGSVFPIAVSLPGGAVPLRLKPPARKENANDARPPKAATPIRSASVGSGQQACRGAYLLRVGWSPGATHAGQKAALPAIVLAGRLAGKGG